jgi:hypothetical protein
MPPHHAGEARPEGLTSYFTCQHPYASRRVYRATSPDDGETAECEVCWSCASVRSQPGGPWVPRSFLYRSGDLLELDGRVRIPGYIPWTRRVMRNCITDPSDG